MITFFEIQLFAIPVGQIKVYFEPKAMQILYNFMTFLCMKLSIFHTVLPDYEKFNMMTPQFSLSLSSVQSMPHSTKQPKPIKIEIFSNTKINFLIYIMSKLCKYYLPNFYSERYMISLACEEYHILPL